MGLLTTLTAARNELGITRTDHDAILTQIIKRISAIIQRFCNRQFLRSEYTEYYNGKGLDIHGQDHNVIFVKNPPIVANSVTLHDDTERVYASADLIATSDFIIEDDNSGAIRLDGLIFQKGLRNIKVTYSGGYAASGTTGYALTADVSDVEMGTLIWTGYTFKRYRDKLYGRTTTERGGVTETIHIGRMPPEVLEILTQYRHIGI